MSFEIKSKLVVSVFTHEKDVEIALKQGKYSVQENHHGLLLSSEKETFDPDEVTWEYVGDEEYASIGSDIPYFQVKDKKSTDPDLDMDWVYDNINDKHYQFLNTIIAMIPCGTGGALCIWTTKNEKGHIIGVKFNEGNPLD